MIWELLIVFALILTNGFFAMSEMAIISVRRARLQQLADGRSGSRVKTVLELSANPTHILSTVQVGMTLTGIVAGAFGGATLAERLGGFLDGVEWMAPYGHQVSFAFVVAVITYLTLIIGELVPKRVALARPERIAIAVAKPMNRLARATAPMVWLLGASTEAMLKLFRLPHSRDHTVTEDEVKTLIAEGTQHGVFEQAEKQMIEGVLKLSDRIVRSIMTPRPDIMWLDLNDPPEAISREIRQSGYSRFLVCRGDVDEVQGIVSSKALLNQALGGQPFDVRAVLVEALIVHDGTPVMRLIDLFKQASVHMAVVVDEYGSVEGLVTINDVIEAVAGDMPEQGQDNEAAIIRRDDGSWLMDGMTPIEDVETTIEVIGLREHEDDYHTLAGFMLDRLGHLPTASEWFIWRGLRFEVMDMDGRRIDKVLVIRVGPDEEREE